MNQTNETERGMFITIKQKGVFRRDFLINEFEEFKELHNIFMGFQVNNGLMLNNIIPNEDLFSLFMNRPDIHEEFIVDSHNISIHYSESSE